MSSNAPARPVMALPRRLLAVAVAAALVATVLTVTRLDTSPAGAQSPTCVTATNSQHVAAGRATRFLLGAIAVGSYDYLGLIFSTTTLQQDGPNVWRRVTTCSTPTTDPGSTTTLPGGSRPPLTQRYTAMYETDIRIPGHTVYRPSNLAAVTEPMPIVVWGNGACVANGTWFQEFLTPLAAHGVLVIANGTPNGSGSTNSDMLIDAVDWAVAENTRTGSKYFGKLDTNAISAMGQSCGGLEAMGASSDPRIDSTVLWNSGIFPSGGLGGVDKTALTRLHAPTAWFTGGQSDIAYGNAVDDYQRVPTRIPAVIGHYDNVGHMGLFTDPAVERQIVTVAAQWLDATLFANPTARAQFVGPNCGLCRTNPWVIQSKNW